MSLSAHTFKLAAPKVEPDDHPSAQDPREYEYYDEEVGSGAKSSMGPKQLQPQGE